MLCSSRRYLNYNNSLSFESVSSQSRTSPIFRARSLLFGVNDNVEVEVQVKCLSRGPLTNRDWGYSKWYRDRSSCSFPTLSSRDRTDVISIVHSSVAEGARSLEEMLKPGVWHSHAPGDVHRDFEGGRWISFAGLIGGLPKFEDGERVLTGRGELLQCNWFGTGRNGEGG